MAEALSIHRLLPGERGAREALIGLPKQCCKLLLVQATIRDAEEHGYYVEAPDTSEVSGPVQLDPGPSRPRRASAPHGHMLLTDALAKLVMVHPAGADPDYHRVRGYLESRIRAALDIGPNEHFDAEAWADELLEGTISWTRQRRD